MPQTSKKHFSATTRKEKAQIKRLSSVVEGRTKFKGQMLEMPIWRSLLFLGTPVIRDVKQLAEAGLYLNDLSNFDTSKDMILAGSQHSDELMELFEKQLEKSKKLEENMRELNKFRQKTDELLYQCIPKSIGKRLRKGVSAMDTCQVFQSVSICFSKVVDFLQICSEIEVGKIVDLLNEMYTIFDNLTELYKVYKVETISDSYMLVSGAPSPTYHHSAHITEMALSMIECTSKKLKNPANPNSGIELLIGCHSGMIVAGIVGCKMPRYCLFGDTVNTSSRMMSHGAPNRIHVSDKFYENLSGCPYNSTKRGEMEVKGKGKMTTYFIDSRNFGEEYTKFKELLEEDRLMHDESPEDTVSTSSRISSAAAIQNYESFKDDDEEEEVEEDLIVEDEETLLNKRRSESKTNDTLMKEDVFKEALKRLEIQEKTKYLKNYVDETSSTTETKELDSNDTMENFPLSIMKSTTSKRKKGIVLFDREENNVSHTYNCQTESSSSTNSFMEKEHTINGINGTLRNNTEHNTRSWIDEIKHIEKELTKGLTFVAIQRPADPIESLAIWLKHNCAGGGAH